MILTFIILMTADDFFGFKKCAFMLFIIKLAVGSSVLVKNAKNISNSIVFDVMQLANLPQLQSMYLVGIYDVDPLLMGDFLVSLNLPSDFLSLS